MSRKEYYERNKERIKQRSRDYYNAHREEIRLRTNLKRKNNPRWVKGNNTKAKYDLSLEEYEYKFHSQGDKCKICEIPLVLGKESHLDHCHKTGKLRDFLCEDCNKGLGRFKDSPEILQKAILYLQHHAN